MSSYLRDTTLASALSGIGTPTSLQYANLLNADKCSPYSYFGSQGPDFLFFLMRDYPPPIGGPLATLVNTTFKFYDTLEPFIDFYEDNIEPVVTQIENSAINALNNLLGGLLIPVMNTFDMMSTAALSAAGSIFTSQVDLFYPFYPKIQKGLTEDKWPWLDYCHSTRTGDFCSKMWSIAGSNQNLKRYCVGYANHIATDVTGHPFVNSIVDGPYRMHWHRHKLVENFIDAYTRNHINYRDPLWVRNCLALSSTDEYLENEIAGSYYYKLCKFPNEEGLPKDQKLGNMILEAMNSIYISRPLHPPKLTYKDLDSAYRIWLKLFERFTTIGTMKPPVFVPSPNANISNLVNNYVSGFPPFPGGGLNNGGAGITLCDLFKKILEFLNWLKDSIIYTFNWIVNNISTIINSLASDPTIVKDFLKWMIYQLQLGIYNFYDNYRFMLVLGGYLFPESGDLSKNPWGKAFINTQYVHLTGGPHAVYGNYPLRQESHMLIGTTEHHLPYPSTSVENYLTESLPFNMFGKNPEESFIDSWQPVSPAYDKLFNCPSPFPPSAPPATQVIDDMSKYSGAQLGSSVFFAAKLITEKMAALPNMNMDGDRGYGWKTWRPDATTAPNINTIDPVKVNYI